MDRLRAARRRSLAPRGPGEFERACLSALNSSRECELGLHDTCDAGSLGLGLPSRFADLLRMFRAWLYVVSVVVGVPGR